MGYELLRKMGKNMFQVDCNSKYMFIIPADHVEDIPVWYIAENLWDPFTPGIAVITAC